MSCWRGAVYGLGMSQPFLMLGVELVYPPARVQTWAYTPCVANGTLVHECPSPRATSWGLQLPGVVASVAAAFFVSNSYALSDGGRLTDESSYCAEALGELGLWDTLFWVVVALTHALAVLMACSPGDVFLVIGAVYLLVSGLWAVCRPREGEASALDPMRATSNVVGCLCGLGLVVAGVPSGYSDRYLMLFPLALLDYFLAIGHAWERVPTMETVCNCRVFYACWAAVLLAAMYAAWHEHLQMPVLAAEDPYD